MAQTITLAQKLNDVQAFVTKAWASADEAEIVKAGALIKELAGTVGKIRAKYDDAFDQYEMGMFGDVKFENVTRLRVKSDKVGRPAKAKPASLLDI